MFQNQETGPTADKETGFCYKARGILKSNKKEEITVNVVGRSNDRRKTWLEASNVPSNIVCEMNTMPMVAFKKGSSEPLDLFGPEATKRVKRVQGVRTF